MTTPATLAVRTATPLDLPELVRVTNRAYGVERFCLAGDRTDAEDVASRMASGEFLVVPGPGTSLMASVYLSVAGDRGYLGTLAVDPAFEGRGLAKGLIAAVEDRCRSLGCAFLDLTVVNLRQELFPFYAKRGFAITGILPFPRPEKILQPLHLVQMTKAL